MHRRSSQFLLLASLAIASTLTTAQNIDDINPAAKSIAMAMKLPGYDVASIHQNKSGLSDSSLDTTDDGVVIENASFPEIVEFAYNIASFDLIAGISGPLASARFDIKAKIAARDDPKSARFTDDQLQAMIIPLLANRFHLRTRVVPKMMVVYEIVVAKGGPKFNLKGPRTNPGSLSIGFSGKDNVLIAKKASMPTLAGVLSDSSLHRLVVDRTGLKGNGDFSLRWSSNVAEEEGGPNFVSIFTAIEDQLGLKLQPVKLPVDTLVIDHAEMPSQN